MGTKTSDITDISLKNHHAVNEVFVCIIFWCAGNVHGLIGLCSLEETNSDHCVIIQGVVRGTKNENNPLSLQEMKDSFQRKINFRTKSFFLC
jgi:hypothetical protein